MVMIITSPESLGEPNHPNKHEFYMNKDLKQNLDIELSSMKQSVQDCVLVIDGLEGSGKSKKARQIAHYCSQKLGSSFDYDGVGNIHNDINKYIDTSLDAGAFAVNILDESRNALLKVTSQSRSAVRFTNFLSECRALRQVHIILLPAYHDLAKYVVLWRMNFLIHLKKKMIPDAKMDGGYKLILGEYVIYPNDSYTKYFYDEKYHYNKKWSVRDKFPNFEVLSKKGLVAYENQKTALLSTKYGSTGQLKVGQKDNGLTRIRRLHRWMDCIPCPKCKHEQSIPTKIRAEIFECTVQTINTGRKLARETAP